MGNASFIRRYEPARSFLSTDASPTDLVPDGLGCAETVTVIARQTLGDHLRVENRLSTYWLYKALRESRNFKDVFIPTPGLIVISPTGHGTGRTMALSSFHMTSAT